MNTVYYNGKFLNKDLVSINPDDRGFLFADGIYEVIRWYGSGFFDINSHMDRLKRSLHEIHVSWKDVELFPSVSIQLIKQNGLENSPAMVYLQVTRGSARRTHNFPSPAVLPTIYAYAFETTPDKNSAKDGIRAMLKEDIRWSRCDIKSISLLPNILGFEEAYSGGFRECIFVRNGNITEGAHSNIFFVKDDILYTHPESNFILSGITRKNTVILAKEAGIPVKEKAMTENELPGVQEAFITNTSAEITPVTELGGMKINNGKPGPITRLLQEKFSTLTSSLQK